MSDQRNNARIGFTGIYIPICKAEQVMASPFSIWKGFEVTEDDTSESVRGYIFFSRTYQPDINEFDKIYPEIEFKDTSIIGIPFILVPKEKVLFRYQAPTEGGIVLPKSLQKGNKGGIHI